MATIVALVTLATGVLTLREQIFGTDEDAAAPVDPEDDEIPSFRGVAGHLEQSRALLDFLDQHNGEIVYLDVGFPEHRTPGPVSGDNVLVENVPVEDGTTTNVTHLSLMTECTSDLPVGTENPTVADGCMGSTLTIGGPETADSGTTLAHGVPEIEGYFEIDVTGGLQMGLSPIGLTPLTFEEARGS